MKSKEWSRHVVSVLILGLSVIKVAPETVPSFRESWEREVTAAWRSSGDTMDTANSF
jgi:hypothetical protein